MIILNYQVHEECLWDWIVEKRGEINRQGYMQNAPRLNITPVSYGSGAQHSSRCQRLRETDQRLRETVKRFEAAQTNDE